MHLDPLVQFHTTQPERSASKADEALPECSIKDISGDTIRAISSHLNERDLVNFAAVSKHFQIALSEPQIQKRLRSPRLLHAIIQDRQEPLSLPFAYGLDRSARLLSNAQKTTMTLRHEDREERRQAKWAYAHPRFARTKILSVAGNQIREHERLLALNDFSKAMATEAGNTRDRLIENLTNFSHDLCRDHQLRLLDEAIRITEPFSRGTALDSLKSAVASFSVEKRIEWIKASNSCGVVSWDDNNGGLAARSAGEIVHSVLLDLPNVSDESFEQALKRFST